jgi:hypothetical protein
MHPILKDRRILSLYLIVWLALALMLAALIAIPGKIPGIAALALSLPLMLVYAFVSLSAWYLCRAFPLHATNIARLLVSNILAAVLSSALWVLAAAGWGTVLAWLQPELGPQGWYRDALPLLAAAGVVLFLLAVTVHYLIATFEASRLAERSALELQVLARDAQLKALRAQIDPHFLFNSLNSISALTATDPAAARTMTLKLAEFLRLSMKYGTCDSITLAQEFSLVEQFLDIEKVRFGSRLQIQAAMDEGVRDCRVAPLLLQPLVENAVGHGIAGLVEGGTLQLHAGLTGNRLLITVENPVDPDRRTATGSGVGLENVRLRLRGLYGTEGRMDITNGSGRFLVAVSFPADLSPRAPLP